MLPSKVIKKLVEMHFGHHGHLSFSNHQSSHVSFHIKSEMYSEICNIIPYGRWGGQAAAFPLVGRGTSSYQSLTLVVAVAGMASGRLLTWS